SALAIWKVVKNSSTTTGKLYHLHRDYASTALSTGLGSILLITDSIGTIAEQRQFDAWGNIVKLTDGSKSLFKFIL
ncbi:MAG TPA: hypothetical protein PKA53_09980, partial [Sphingobacterium sp.]|nr:hypothetical protein [Sphingobacterium sp.]